MQTIFHLFNSARIAVQLENEIDHCDFMAGALPAFIFFF